MGEEPGDGVPGVRQGRRTVPSVLAQAKRVQWPKKYVRRRHMRILVVGASGTLGKAVTAALEERGHDVLEASRSSEHFVDLTERSTIDDLFRVIGTVDAVACTAGVTPFLPFAELTSEDFNTGINDKLLGQVELVRRGLPHVEDRGSFTLVSGVTATDPIVTGAVASLVNGGLDAFVHAAAIEMPRGIRINAVSPTALEEAWDLYAPYFPGHRPVRAAEAGRAYVKSIEGAQTGRTYRVGY
jgi:NAD(P)-dependent dehydrogenase (short-subunit alcohol dehydrogenase family)